MIFRGSLLLLVFLLTSGCVSGSSAQRLPPAAPAPVAAEQPVTIVNGPWRFHTGDDIRWADPAFDDSNWEPYNIDSTAPLTVPEVIDLPRVPGWQAHGHSGYVGYAWYRISVDPGSARRDLAVLMPQYVEDAYQVYVNGQPIGAFGQFESPRFVYDPRPALFPIPAEVTPAMGPLTIALRFRVSALRGLPKISTTHGGLRGVPILGDAGFLAFCQRAEMGQIENQSWSALSYSVLYASVGLISLFLFVFTRTRREYLWAGISLTGIATMMGSPVIGLLAQLPTQIMIPCRFLGEWVGLSAGPISVMWLLGVHKPVWRRLNYVSSMAIAVSLAILTFVFLGLAPPTLAWERAMDSQYFVLFGVASLLLAIAIDGVLTTGARAWIPLTPGLFGACGLVAEVGGPQFSVVSNVLYALLPVALLIVFLLRFAEQHRENEQYLLDVRQAQEIQQLLLPEHLPHTAGFSIESVYLPAREVGGDFFQILETGPGSALIVFGDVAGKGLPAAMLVAMLVGVIRTRAKETSDPAEILSALNACLCGNTRGGFATCLAAHVSADGTVDLANAGHAEPYRNGKEINVGGALPLGVAPGIEFATARFALAPGDSLTFVSDGVAEAKNSRQELFGFDRLRKISTQSARQIADAASRFGQEDDITVLTFAFLPVPAETMAANSR